MTKIIVSITITALVFLGMAYGALVILGRVAELVDTNDWVAGGAGVVLAIVFALTLTARR